MLDCVFGGSMEGQVPIMGEQHHLSEIPHHLCIRTMDGADDDTAIASQVRAGHHHAFSHHTIQTTGWFIQEDEGRTLKFRGRGREVGKSK